VLRAIGRSLGRLEAAADSTTSAGAAFRQSQHFSASFVSFIDYAKFADVLHLHSHRHQSTALFDSLPPSLAVKRPPLQFWLSGAVRAWLLRDGR
jgi:hypothetical protein